MPSLYRTSLLLLLVGVVSDARGADGFDGFLKPLFTQRCVKCHGGKRTRGKVDLKKIETTAQLLAEPKLIREIIEVIDASDMPPEDEPELSEKDRAKLLAALKAMLRAATSGRVAGRVPMRRLNRFQYNNCVRDLFRLKTDLFRLPEKLMTRHGAHLASLSGVGASGGAGRLPDTVEVECRSLSEGGGWREVIAFPKDLRAAHGYDNQANQLTLSPLLLDAFLKLSVSIIESPDFREENVGIWNDFFREPAEATDVEAEVTKRLGPFLRQAFRGATDKETLRRYAEYTSAKIRQGTSFTDSMKKAASAVLCSPKFLYRYGSGKSGEGALELASNLSFFLWASSPDLKLLRSAESGELSKPEVLSATLERMLADPKIERFLDTFPSQWMQLENVFAATPDPNKQRFFSLDRNRPASLQMVLEPLLLFDAVFVENRPILELIVPPFSYQSDFLQTWYGSDLTPPGLDEVEIAAENRRRQDRLAVLATARRAIRSELEAHDRSLPELIGEKLETIDLAAGQVKWEAAQAEIVAESVWLSSWQRIGPFAAASFDEAHAKAFVDESAVDVKERYGKLKWTEAKSFVDGEVHTLDGANSATYLYRTLRVGSARPLNVSLGSDDSFKVWLNGRLVADKKVLRGVAPDQDQVRLDLVKGENALLMKVVNGGGGYGFYFKAQPSTLPAPVLAALRLRAGERSAEQRDALAEYYFGIAPELAPLRRQHAEKRADLTRKLREAVLAVQRAPKPLDPEKLRQEARRRFDDEIRRQLQMRKFRRLPAADPRYGGVITNAAMLSMTSGPKRTHPIARGAWVVEVILNDPPPPPPNDVPPLNEDDGQEHLTIRERFARHRESPDCAGCHSRLDPLGFALENFDITGRWRDKYENGRDVDASGTLLKKHDFAGIVQFKESLLKEKRRFAKAFTGHLLRFALSRELVPADTLTIEDIVAKTEKEDFRVRSILREVVLSRSFRGQDP